MKENVFIAITDNILIIISCYGSMMRVIKLFSFYGSKAKILKWYPIPKYDLLIEPFAGSAKYALKYFEKDVVLMELDKTIYGVWKYLQGATPKMIRSLPDVENARELASISGFSQLAQEEKWLIGFCSNGGSATPKNYSGRHNFNSWNKDRERIALDLHKIRHWKILNGNYYELGNQKATWFIDPPYIDKGKWYKEHSIDYPKLAQWCLGLDGQVIVCEAGEADWLPFTHLKDIPFTHFKNDVDKKRKTSEVVYIKES